MNFIIDQQRKLDRRDDPHVRAPRAWHQVGVQNHWSDRRHPNEDLVVWKSDLAAEERAGLFAKVQRLLAKVDYQGESAPTVVTDDVPKVAEKDDMTLLMQRNRQKANQEMAGHSTRTSVVYDWALLLHLLRASVVDEIATAQMKASEAMVFVATVFVVTVFVVMVFVVMVSVAMVSAVMVFAEMVFVGVVAVFAEKRAR